MTVLWTLISVAGPSWRMGRRLSQDTEESFSFLLRCAWLDISWSLPQVWLLILAVLTLSLWMFKGPLMGKYWLFHDGWVCLAPAFLSNQVLQVSNGLKMAHRHGLWNVSRWTLQTGWGCSFLSTHCCLNSLWLGTSCLQLSGLGL